MLKRGYLKYGLVLITSVLILCGCSVNGYYEGCNEPMSFTAAISGRTQTRATVDTGRASGSSLIVCTAEPAKVTTENVGKLTRTSTTPDGVWPSGANVSVHVSGNSNTAQYKVNADGTITSGSPLYWTSNNNVTVTSWYPYSASMPSSWSVNSDQSKSDESDYNGSDFLYASNTFTYGGGSSNKLQYAHETAKVVINIVKANDVTSASNISFVTIGTSGTPIDLSGTIGSTGAITASTTSTGYITPYQTTSSTYAATYSALVIPQDMNGKQFIAIKVVGGNTFYYMPSKSTSLSGGYVYTYNVTVPSSKANIGDYYFSDGSWGTLAVHATSTVKPIGVIFSNSPSTIDQGYGWKHGYAMALTNASTGALWAGSSYQSTDEAGDKFGSFTYVDYTGTYDTSIINKDGYSETHAISNKSIYSQNNYPAFYYALNYNVTCPNISSSWFLPSVGQWWDILINLGGMSTTPVAVGPDWCNWGGYLSTCVNNIDKYLSAISSYITPDLFNNTYGNAYVRYWSSSEFNSTYSFYTHFGNGVSNSDGTGLDLHINADDDRGSKSNTYIVRPVMAF
jgi:hypothetical protein